jgi:hypothetical protein
MRNTIVPTSFLRRVWWADAAVSAVVGAAMAGAAGPLGELVGLPARLLATAGLSLLPYAAFLAWLATRSAVPRAAAWAPVLLNVVWAIDCVALAVMQSGGDAPAGRLHRRAGDHRPRLRRTGIRRSPACAGRRRGALTPKVARAIGYRRRVARKRNTEAAPAAAAAPRSRFDRLDALRGVAIVWMAIFHFCYDLNYFGFIRQDMLQDPKWTLQRAGIVTLFLLCAGAGQEIASHQGQPLARFWRRWAQIAGCALLVSAASWLMFPRTWISFGVLHGIALMLIVVRFTASWGAWRFRARRDRDRPAAAGAASVLRQPGHRLDRPGDAPAGDRGLRTGAALARRDVVGRGDDRLAAAHRKSVLAGPLPRPLAGLAFLGRWSLTFYMTHQLVLMGGVAAAAWLLGRMR